MVLTGERDHVKTFILRGRFLLTNCLTIRVELLAAQLRRCKPMSKRLSTIYVGIQSE